MVKARNNRADTTEPARQGEVGRLLRETREGMGIDLRAASDTLRIRFAHLLAIEEGRYGDMPGPAYAVGFVRTYAEYLRLDGEEIVRRFKEESSIEPQNNLAFPTPVSEGGLPSGALILAALVLAGGVYGAWHFTSSGERSVAEMIQDVPERLSALLPKREEPPEAVLPAAGTAEESATPNEVVEEQRFLDKETVTAHLAAEAGTAAEEAPGDAGDVPAEEVAASAAAPAPAPAPTPAPAATPVSAPAAAPPPPAAATSAETAVVMADEPPPPADVVGSVPPEAASDSPGEPSSEPAAEEVVAAAAPAAPAPEAEAPAPKAPVASAPVASVPVTSAPAPTPAPTPAPEEAKREVVPAPMPKVADDRSAPPAPALQEAAVPAEGRVYWPENTDARVVLKVKADSWIQIRDQDALLLTRLLKRGDSLMVPNRAGLTLMTGNAGGMVIEVDGAALPPLGHAGEVRKGLSLDADSLKGGGARAN